MSDRPQPEAFTVDNGSGTVLRGETVGAGRDVVLCHGLSATRRYVVHGSLYLPRKGYRMVTYDARGHGESDPAGDGYRYPGLVADLTRVIEATAGLQPGGGVILGGHSMGCHTAAAWALANPGAVAALILAGPAWSGHEESSGALAHWDRRAEALEQGGPEGFADEMAKGMEGDVARRVHRLARDRAALHRHPAAVAQALREVPRSSPFGALDTLAGVGVPTLILASRDRFDPAHPLAVARAWAEAVPEAELRVEAEGDPPLTWQGGRLSREINRFLEARGLGGSGGPEPEQGPSSPADTLPSARSPGEQPRR